MNLRELVGGIRLRIIEEINRTDAALPARQFLSLRDANTQLRIAFEDMQNSATAVGRMPPNPGTLRARTSAHLVRLVQRMLFWYTPQVVRFNAAASFFAQQVCLVGEKEIAAMEELANKIAALSTELRLSGERQVIGGDAHPTNNESSFPDAGFDSFVSEFRNRSESSLNEQRSCFPELRRMLDLAPAIPKGRWIDLECGSGAWMQSILDRNRDIAGVEPNGAEAARCQALGLRVFRMDPVRFLSEADCQGLAGITALRVLEHHPMFWNFHLLRECARNLLPGGVILITCADPASVFAGARDFWQDPRSFRPIPIQTVTAMIDHLGFQILSIRALRAWREEEQLPLAGLEPVRELNARLFGPREYAILARREPGK